MAIDNALATLGASLDRLGVERWRPPEDLSVLEELEAEIAPLRIPAQLKALWEQVDPATVRVAPHPKFCPIDFSLWSWRTSRDEFLSAQPLALLTFAYESHVCMAMELHAGEFEGGALFTYAVDGPLFVRRFNDLAGWLLSIADLLDRGWARRLDGPSGPRLLVPDPDRWQEEQVAQPIPPPHPTHGAVLEYDGDIMAWPAHWRRINGVHEEGMELRGATHSLHDVLASPPDAELRATVRGRVVNLGGGRGMFARIQDGTGEISVDCPVETTLLGPRMRAWFEFDIVVPPGPRVSPPDPEAAAAGAADDAARVSAILMARHGGPATATATAIRRVPDSV